MTIEQLIIDDSFINYCFRKKAEDVEYWMSYIEKHPEELPTINEAYSFVLGLSDILQYVKNPDSAESQLQYLLPEEVQKQQKNFFSGIGHQKQKFWLVAASIIFLLTIGVIFFFPNKQQAHNKISKSNTYGPGGEKYNVEGITIYQTGTGEQKTVWLPDNTKIIMNASSKLSVAKDYGSKSRMVFLEGEALFDVTHNKAAPFVVEVKDFTIKVLGTKFNVRSYITDKQSEAALLRGKIEVSMKSTPDEKMILLPLQKVVVSNKKLISSSLVTARDNKKLPSLAQGVSLPGNIEESVIETSWIFNRLEIVDEPFEDFAASLERRFGVTINFQDEQVKKYKYTAVFESENIDQVLKALAGSLLFNYERKGNVIIIKK